VAEVELVDVVLAEWLTGLRRASSDSGHEHRVRELLPPGYDVYLRLFHPFVPWDVPVQARKPEELRTWRSVAEQAGVRYHEQITWRSISRALPVIDGSRELAVADGDLDPVVRGALRGVLGAATSGQSWLFYYGLSVMVSGRTPVLFCSSLDSIHDVIRTAVEEHSAVVESPELVWPEDRAWVVCTGYDLTSTYIACSRDVAARVAAGPHLETLEVSRQTRIDDYADEPSPS
jgi:hypothetical protein